MTAVPWVVESVDTMAVYLVLMMAVLMVAMIVGLTVLQWAEYLVY